MKRWQKAFEKQGYISDHHIETNKRIFEAGYRACLDDINNNCRGQIVALFQQQILWDAYKDFADEEVDDVPPCGTDEVNNEKI